MTIRYKPEANMCTCDTEPSPGGGANRKNRRRPQCHYCHAYGHIKTHCRKLAGPMEPVSQQQARQQPTAATHRGTGAKQSVYALQQTNQHAPRDQPCAQDSGHLADSHRHHPAPATGGVFAYIYGILAKFQQRLNSWSRSEESARRP